MCVCVFARPPPPRITPPPAILCVNQSLSLQGATHPLERAPHTIHPCRKIAPYERQFKPLVVRKIHLPISAPPPPPSSLVSANRWADVSCRISTTPFYYQASRLCAALSFTGARKTPNPHGSVIGSATL